MNVWQFVKEKSEYIWLALYLTMAGILYADDDPTGAWTLFGVGLFLFVVLKLAAAKRKRDDVKRKQAWEQGTEPCDFDRDVAALLGMAPEKVAQLRRSGVLKVSPEPKSQTWEQAELEVLRRTGAEPVPIPGEKGYAGHDPENCIYCEVKEP